MSPRDQTAEDLRRQSEAARNLITALKADGQEDEDLLHDMTEGSTDLFEAVDRALAEIDECEIMETGIKAKQAELSDRLKRASDRKERLRSLIEQALVIADLRTMKRPTATLTVKDAAPKLLIADEASIPAQFWKQPDPVLDRKALNDACKAGEIIPGTTMTNGTTTLQLRRS